MRLLVVEGNAQSGSHRIAGLGGKPYHQGYADTLRRLQPGAEIVWAFPSESGANALPDRFAFSDFDGAAWTGSSLDVYIDSPPVRNQLAFAEKLFASGVPIFGSCWGLQILTQALGGRVHRNPRGREIGVAAPITLNAAGRAHPMYAGKADRFPAFTVHLDEVIEPVPGGTLLAANPMSPVQAFAYENAGGRFWGVQYHPEFDRATMGLIYDRLRPALIEEGLFASDAEVDAAKAALTKAPNVFDQIELRNWLGSLTA